MTNNSLQHTLNERIARFTTEPGWRGRFEGVVRLNVLDGEGSQYLFYGGDSPRVDEIGSSAHPPKGDCAWSLSQETLDRLLSRELSPQVAFHLGELRIEGKLPLSLSFSELFA